MAENTGSSTLFSSRVWSIRAATASVVPISYFVYCAMEEENRQTQEPSGCGPRSPATRLTASSLKGRSGILFSALTGAAPFSHLRAQEYVARLHQVAQETPEVAWWAITNRYIGDLSPVCDPQRTLPRRR